MMRHMPAIPEPTRSSIIVRLLDHTEKNWPQLAKVRARYHGSFAYITGVLRDGEQIPLFRLRYGGSAHSFGFAIYSPARDRYEDAVMLTGLPIGSPQEALEPPAPSTSQDSDTNPNHDPQRTSGTTHLSQSIWRQLVNQLDELQDPGAQAGWLAAAARRECGNARSAAGGLQIAGDIAGAGHQPRHQAGTGEQERLAAERHAALREAFSRLSPGCQRLLTLLIDDPPMPDAEIIARLGIPVGSIGPARRHCLDKLRRDPVIAALTGAGTAPWPTPGRAAG